VTNGICSETDWPYIEDKCTVTPSNQSYIDAKKDLITNYFSLETIEDIKQCLADGYPVVYGITLHESFESDEVAQTGIVPYPKKHEEILGGHGMELVGYNDSDPNNPIFIDRNSWGQWGLSGYCILPQAMVMKWGSDFWTIRGDSQVK
jgi:C1A family cysteine protease